MYSTFFDTAVLQSKSRVVIESCGVVLPAFERVQQSADV